MAIREKDRLSRCREVKGKPLVPQGTFQNR